MNNQKTVPIILFVLSICFLVLTGTTVGLSTVQWDEFTDLVIANQLSFHPLSGHDYDGSQARLPMYITAVAYRLMRLFNPNVELLDLLPISRWLSILFNVPAIWGTYLLGRRLFSSTVGLFAASLLTISPFFLHFSRSALTQGDAFTTTTVIFTLIAFERFHNRRTTFWLAIFAFCLALAIASKFFLVVLIPALLTFQFILELSERYRKPDPFAEYIDRERPTIDWPYTVLAVATGLLSLIALLVAYQRDGQSASTYQLMTNIARFSWVLTLVGIFIALALPLKGQFFRYRKSDTIKKVWRLDHAWLAVLPLTLAMVLALFPAHIFNPEVLSSLLERFVTMDGNTNLVGTSIDSIKLYVGLILFKLGIPFGLVTFIALAWGTWNASRSQAFLLITIIFVYYGLLLAVLPLQQPFWLMSVYPLILITLSAALVQSFKNIENNRFRLAWTGYIVFAVGWLLIGLGQVYPTYGYYGYEVVGNTWLGNNSRGHRSLVVVTNDGSTEAIDWLRENAPDGAVVVSYLGDPHIVNYLNTVQPFSFELKHALQYLDRNQLIEELERADYVIARPIDDIDFPLVSTDSNFKELFGEEPVYQIYRGRGGYRMPVFQIYYKGH